MFRGGGASQIDAEFILLEAAAENGPYDFYHLITGVDFPLASQNEILAFYDKYPNTQFISCRPIKDEETNYLDRIKFFYPFQEFFLRQSFWGKFLRKVGVRFQRLLHINRLNSSITYGVGSAYFDITDDFARYVLSRRQWTTECFKKTLCADEIFLQTIYLNSPFYQEDTHRYKSDSADNECIERTYLDVNRAIDWHRGNPYTFRIGDKEMLLSSHCFFARKFDERTDKEIIDFLYHRLIND